MDDAIDGKLTFTPMIYPDDNCGRNTEYNHTDTDEPIQLYEYEDDGIHVNHVDGTQ